MPGLLRGVARVAVVAGTATAVSGRVSRRQQGRWANQDAEQAQEQQPAEDEAAPAEESPAAEAPAEPDMDAKYDQLKKLGDLHESGILTDEEFAAEKAKILG